MHGSKAALTELDWNGRGRDIALQIAIRPLLVGVDQIFNPSLTNDVQRKLALLAEVTAKVLEQRPALNRFTLALARGRWQRALECATEASKGTGVSEEEAFSVLLGVLLLPSCYVDQFTVAVLRGIKVGEVLNQRAMRETPTFKALCKSWAQWPTRDTLVRFVVSSATLESRNLGLSMFIVDELDSERFERFQKVLQFVRENNEAYAAVMRLVNEEKWVEANEVATDYLRSACFNAEQDFDDPPPLADFLLLALIHVLDPAEVTQARHNGHWS